VDSAALGAQVPEEPAVPVRARPLRVRQPVLAGLLLRLAVPVPVQRPVPLQAPVPAVPLREGRWVPAHLVLAVPVERLLSRLSCSVAMARSTP
jgi:hypothetical protein